MDEYYLVGKIKAIYKNNGFVTIESFSDFDDRFDQLEYFVVKIYGVVKKLQIRKVNRTNNDILIQFKNFDSAEAVKPLMGLELFVDEKNSVKLDNNTHFIHDLVGCIVFDPHKKIGVLKDVYVLDSNDIYVVLKDDNEEVLIPGIDDYIDYIDIENRVIKLRQDLENIFLDED